jgi:hypothetical protein
MSAHENTKAATGSDYATVEEMKEGEAVLLGCHPDLWRERATTSMNEPQPAPIDTGSPAVWPMVIADVEGGLGDMYCAADVLPLVLADMRERDAGGRAKYGVPLRADNGRDHFIDALQEAYDCAVYTRAELQRAITEGRHPGVIVRIYRSVLQNAFSIRSAIAARDGQSARQQEAELSEAERLTVALAVQAQATSETAAKLHSRSPRVDPSGEVARAVLGLGPDDEDVDTLAHVAELKRKAKAFDARPVLTADRAREMAHSVLESIHESGNHVECIAAILLRVAGPVTAEQASVALTSAVAEQSADGLCLECLKNDHPRKLEPVSRGGERGQPVCDWHAADYAARRAQGETGHGMLVAHPAMAMVAEAIRKEQAEGGDFATNEASEGL